VLPALIAIVVPVFGLVACGVAVRALGLLSADGAKALGLFVYAVATPALLFRTMAGLAPPSLDDAGLLVAYFAPCLAVYALAHLAGRGFGTGADGRAVMAMGATFSNTVLLGIPLTLEAYGPPGLKPLMLIISVHSAILITVTTVLVEAARGAGNAGGTVRAAAIAMAKNPMVNSIAAGLALSASGIGLAAPVDVFLRLLGQATVPCSLIALGASLLGYRLAANLPETLVATTAKLMVLPALVYVATKYGAGLDQMTVEVATLCAAMPAGTNVYLLAQRYEVATARTASLVLISTVLSLPTTTGLLALFQLARI
jgi:hypothetical protein